MKLHARAVTLLTWLEQRESASVGEIAASGLMGAREASDVVRYAMRNGAVGKAMSGTGARGTARYRLTGSPLPEPCTTANVPSFDDLLTAWGIARHPPHMRVVATRINLLADSASDGEGGG